MNKGGRYESKAVHGGKDHWDTAGARSCAAYRERFNRLDVIVNNAGIAGASTCRIHKYDLELWDRVMGVNLRGAFLVLQHALPLMIATGQGAVVNIASLGSPSLLRPYGDESRDIGLYTPSRA